MDSSRISVRIRKLLSVAIISPSVVVVGCLEIVIKTVNSFSSLTDEPRVSLTPQNHRIKIGIIFKIKKILWLSAHRCSLSFRGYAQKKIKMKIVERERSWEIIISWNHSIHHGIHYHTKHSLKYFKIFQQWKYAHCCLADLSRVHSKTKFNSNRISNF